MVTILKRENTRLRVKEHKVAATSVLGSMLDAMNLPEGHLCCSKCSGYKFECTGYPGGSKVEMGCIGCGERFYMAFPMDVDLPAGKYGCRRHPSKAFIVIHNIDVVSMGCEACKSEINVSLRKAKGIILADA